MPVTDLFLLAIAFIMLGFYLKENKNNKGKQP